MTPFQNQERIKAQILGSYNNVGDTIKPIVKAEQAEEVGKEQKEGEKTEENKEGQEG